MATWGNLEQFHLGTYWRHHDWRDRQRGDLPGPSYRSARKSYAEMGEDLILASIFEQLRIEHPTYLDVGAWDPIELSNTYLLTAPAREESW